MKMAPEEAETQISENWTPKPEDRITEAISKEDKYTVPTSSQDHCEVCAVSLKDVEAALCAWSGRRVEIVSLKPDALADIWEDIAKVARALGRERQGERLVEQLKARMASIAEQSSEARTRPRVAIIEWIDPLMVGGNWMPELVEMTGAENLFGAKGKPSPWLDWDQIVAADPDVVLVHPCGFDLARTLQEMPLFERRPGWRELEAGVSAATAPSAPFPAT